MKKALRAMSFALALTFGVAAGVVGGTAATVVQEAETVEAGNCQYGGTGTTIGWAICTYPDYKYAALVMCNGLWWYQRSWWHYPGQGIAYIYCSNGVKAVGIPTLQKIF